MDLVSANELADRVVHKYFLMLDRDSKDDLFNYIRNFIVFEQERYADYLQSQQANDVTSTEWSTDSEEESEQDQEEEPVEETTLDEIDISPDSKAEVDCVLVYLHIRELFEQVRKLAFVSFWEFYEHVIK